MFNRFSLLGFSIFALASCAGVLQGAARIEQGTVMVSGTEYQTYLLIRSTDPSYRDPENDPAATRAYYAIVGPGATVYCGISSAGCDAAIRRFNNDLQLSEEEM
jgi:hypothetical protein